MISVKEQLNVKDLKVSGDLCLDLNKDLFRWKVNGYPCLICDPILGMLSSPYGWPRSEVFFVGDDCFWYSNWENIEENGMLYYRKYLLGKKDFPKNFYNKFYKLLEEMTLKTNDLMLIDLKKLSQKDFLDIWSDFFEFYRSFWKIVVVPEVAGYALSRFLEKENSRRKHPLSARILSEITTFPELSFLGEEEKSLCRLAVIKDKSILETELKKHRQNFHWMLNGYHGVKKLSLKFFRDRLDDLKSSSLSEKRLRELSTYSQKKKKEAMVIFEKYKLSPLMRNLSLLTQRGSYLQDQRKECLMKATPAIIKLFQELGRRSGLHHKDVFYVLSFEAKECLSGRLLKNEIKKRRLGFRFMATRQSSLYGTKDFNHYFSVLDQAYSKASANVKGTVAYPGKVKGRARVLTRVQDCNKFKKGEILIALMTSPDYIIAMKKSAAIVTDDGGLTCHAAIVARELKIPCIVGTKNATKSIKTGDLVEVDAEAGIINILN